MESDVGKLRKQFWAGKRWVVLDSRQVVATNLRCYFDYQDAVDACRGGDARNEVWRIRVLGSLLKKFSGIDPKVTTSADRERLRNIVSQFPIRFFGPGAQWEGDLLQGNFHPVIWEKVVQPLIEISQYVIVGKDGVAQYRELYKAVDFVDAMTFFMGCKRVAEKKKGDIFLVGQYCAAPLVIHAGGFCDANNGLVLYRAEWLDNRNIIKQVFDPTQPLVRQFAMFARFYSRTGLLFFYDGRLRRIRPGDEPVFIDLEWFDFEVRHF